MSRMVFTSTCYILELRVFDPSIRPSDQTGEGNEILFGPIGRCLGSAKYAIYETGGETTFSISPEEDSPVRLGPYFKCGQEVFAGYSPVKKASVSRVRLVPTSGADHRNFLIGNIWFCQHPDDIATTWAGWTYMATLAFANAKYPHLVKEVVTYACPTARCSSEIASRFGVTEMAIVGSMYDHPIAIARTTCPINPLSDEKRMAVTAGLYFLRMEQELQAGAVEAGKRAASVSRLYHPRTGGTRR